MKKVLLVLLVVSITVSGQKKDSTPTLLLSDSLVKSGTSSGFAPILMYSQAPSSFDTVRVLMLVCDTLHYNNYTPTLNKGNYFDKSGGITWVIGFQVRETFCCVNGNTSQYSVYQAVPYYQYHDYLDSNRKPLQKTIIVWLSQPLSTPIQKK